MVSEESLKKQLTDIEKSAEQRKQEINQLQTDLNNERTKYQKEQQELNKKLQQEQENAAQQKKLMEEKEKKLLEEKDKLEKERLEKEKLEKERLEKERLEKEKFDKEKTKPTSTIEENPEKPKEEEISESIKPKPINKMAPATISATNIKPAVSPNIASRASLFNSGNASPRTLTPTNSSKSLTGKEALLEWCRIQTQNYSEVNLTNWTSSW